MPATATATAGDMFPVSDLILDYNLYPRSSIDRQNVRSIVEAMETGVELPPVIACEKSKRVVDGFHRVAAMKRVRGDDAEIAVEFRRYRTEGDLFAEAIRLNAPHGLKLNRTDRLRCYHLAKRLGVKEATIAKALSIDLKKLRSLIEERTATNGRPEPSEPSEKPREPEPVILKPANKHLAGSRISEQQRLGNDRTGGNSQRFLVDRVIDLFECNLLDRSSETLMERLRHLRDILSSAELGPTP